MSSVEKLQQGLDAVSGGGAGHGYGELLAGIKNDAPWAQTEIGWKPTDTLSVFGFGQWQPKDYSAGIGARLVF